MIVDKRFIMPYNSSISSDLLRKRKLLHVSSLRQTGQHLAYLAVGALFATHLWAPVNFFEIPRFPIVALVDVLTALKLSARSSSTCVRDVGCVTAILQPGPPLFPSVSGAIEDPMTLE